MPKSPANSSRLWQLQQQFTENIRDPEHKAYPDNITKERMEVYQQLLFNNIEEIFKNAFPVINTIINEQQRAHIIRSFMQQHQANTAIFHQIPHEFVEFLTNNSLEKLPFLAELAHYEWLELALELSPISLSDYHYNRHGHLLSGIPFVSPLVELCQYQWPVHQIGADYIPHETNPEPTYLVVYRDAADEVGFLAINPVTAHLLQKLINNQQQTGKQVLYELAHELNALSPQTIINNGKQILEQLHQLQVILGTRELEP